MNDAPAAIDQLVSDLEKTAERLRGGDLEQGEAAQLVERCADLAGRIGGQLDREWRGDAGSRGPGQEQLL